MIADEPLPGQLHARAIGRLSNLLRGLTHAGNGENVHRRFARHEKCSNIFTFVFCRRKA